MALKGRFGRRHRTYTNLTVLIAQLMQQQRAAEDRVMFDAYQNGGLIDGKPVTDGMFLAYLRDRRDSIDKEDPLWEEWNNRYLQQKFNIAESIITTAFARGKASAGAVAPVSSMALKTKVMPPRLITSLATQVVTISRRSGCAPRRSAYRSTRGPGK